MNANRHLACLSSRLCPHLFCFSTTPLLSLPFFPITIYSFLLSFFLSHPSPPIHSLLLPSVSFLIFWTLFQSSFLTPLYLWPSLLLLTPPLSSVTSPHLFATWISSFLIPTLPYPFTSLSISPLDLILSLCTNTPILLDQSRVLVFLLTIINSLSVFKLDVLDSSKRVSIHSQTGLGTQHEMVITVSCCLCILKCHAVYHVLTNCFSGCHDKMPSTNNHVDSWFQRIRYLVASFHALGKNTVVTYSSM